MAPNMFDLKIMAPELTRKAFVWRSLSVRIDSWHEELFYFLEVTYFEVFFGKVWENSAKFLSHPQKFACAYTYIWNMN